jgi:hypothetical protein
MCFAVMPQPCPTMPVIFVNVMIFYRMPAFIFIAGRDDFSFDLTPLITFEIISLRNKKRAGRVLNLPFERLLTQL